MKILSNHEVRHQQGYLGLNSTPSEPAPVPPFTSSELPFTQLQRRTKWKTPAWAASQQDESEPHVPGNLARSCLSTPECTGIPFRQLRFVSS